MKKITKIALLVLGCILILLYLSNPKYEDFKNYIGNLSENQELNMRTNYLIFSYYTDTGYKPTYYSDEYIGILGNFHLTKHKGAGD